MLFILQVSILSEQSVKSLSQNLRVVILQNGKFSLFHIYFVLFHFQIHYQGPEDCPQEKKKIKGGGEKGGGVCTNWIEETVFSQFVCIFKNLGL